MYKTIVYFLAAAGTAKNLKIGGKYPRGSLPLCGRQQVMAHGRFFNSSLKTLVRLSVLLV
jgi:hypothetical protein